MTKTDKLYTACLDNNTRCLIERIFWSIQHSLSSNFLLFIKKLKDSGLNDEELFSLFMSNDFQDVKESMR